MVMQPVVAQSYMMKQKVHTDAVEMRGQKEPAKDYEQTIYMSKEAVVMMNGEGTMINDLKNKKMININHEEKSYVEFSTDMAAGGEESGEANPMAAMMQGLGGSMEFTVESTGVKKEVAGYSCDQYLIKFKVMMMPMEQVVYATKSLKIDKDLMKNYMTSSVGMLPGMQKHLEKIQKEIDKIQGVVVRTESTMSIMGSKIKTWTELQEFKEGNMPADAMKIPAGYEKQDMMGM
jgi:hypothetical protein